MPTRFKIFAVVAALAAGTSSAAMAEYPCAPGYAVYGRPVPSPGYSNPVSGAVSGEESGARSGYATGGPVGAVVGGAIGTATGTANALTAPTVCGPGFTYYNGSCYPAR